jgi:hypothetical protein
MYFYYFERNGHSLVTGPYLLSRDKLLQLNDDKYAGTALSDDDRAILTTSYKEVGVYDSSLQEPNTKFISRDQLSPIEYKSMHGMFLSKSYTNEDWCEMVGISTGQHKHLRGARQIPDRLLSRQLMSMCVSHSYMRQLSANYLGTLTIRGIYVIDTDADKFGALSMLTLRALRESANVGLKSYWAHKTHIDVCSLYPDLVYSRESSSLKENNNWLNSSEWAALTKPLINVSERKIAGLSKEEKYDAREYFNLLNNASKLNEAQHNRLIQLARDLAVTLTENGRGESFKDVSLDTAIKQIVGAEQSSEIEESGLNAMSNLFKHNKENDEYQDDLSTLRLNI